MKKSLLYLCFSLVLVASMDAISQTTDTVKMINSEFVPANLTIMEGTKVVWVNEDAVTHTAESGSNCMADGTWDSGDMVQNDTYSHTFNSSGSFPYFCLYHCTGSNMTGEISVSSVTGADDIGNNTFSVNIYPNPTSGPATLELQIPEARLLQVELFDITGSRVRAIHDGKQKQGTTEIELPVNDIPTGIYFLRIKNGEKVITQKFTKF